MLSTQYQLHPATSPQNAYYSYSHNPLFFNHEKHELHEKASLVLFRVFRVVRGFSLLMLSTQYQPHPAVSP